MSAIAGTFSDLKILRGRKVVQIVVEIPLEKADEALKILGGVPNPASERWVAIAPLLNEPECRPPSEAASEDAGATPDNAPASSSHKRRWAELSPTQQAGILCEDPEFATFAKIVCADLDWNYNDPKIFVRDYCGIATRAQLSTNDAAAERWKTLEADFYAWQHNPRRPA
jgi:hypothetical protein